MGTEQVYGPRQSVVCVKVVKKALCIVKRWQ